jgi:hypothetical protein
LASAAFTTRWAPAPAIAAAALRPARGFGNQRGRFSRQSRPRAPQRERSQAEAWTQTWPARSILGFVNYPAGLEHHCEQLAALPIADQAPRPRSRQAR